MVRTMAGTLPWALVLVVAGGASWWLLSRGVAAGQWLLAALLVGHGVVHLMFAVPAPAVSEGGATWPFNMSGSWAISDAGLGANTVRGVGVALIAVTVGGFLLAGLATVGVVVPSTWWQPLVAVSAVASATVLLLFFDPQLVLGLAMDAVLLGVVVARAWVPGVASS